MFTPSHISGQPVHICGCYYQTQQSPFAGLARHYLPQIRLDSHTTITPLYFTTKLTQTFRNSGSDALKQVRYTFPLYDGVAVCGYTISYAGKVLKGIVKQKDEAKKTYDDAVSRGETAGLLESLPAGVFGVTLGNIPSATDIVVEITYCGELKHDAAIDGLRYTLPTAIAPRYGQYPGELMQMNAQATNGISITVDVDMVGSAVRKVQSPSHPIAVSMGADSTASERATFQPHQASATLTLGTTVLADDFVLQLLIDDIEKPRALVEGHPTLNGHRAIMTTLVPKFVLDSANPEVVFIADQSGSMGGAKNTALVRALRVFLKSLPFGVRFNVCAFGSEHQYLWPKSQAYNEKNVDSALEFVDGFSAGYGGTELLKPIVAAFEQRLGDMALEVMVLTDGQIWGEDYVFDFINKQILEKKVDARVFALGIGNGASSTLVNGMARAGKGFAQFVTETETEKTDQKVMRMLKGALYAHTWDYKLDIEFMDTEKGGEAILTTGKGEEDFELIEQTEESPAISAQPSVSTITTFDSATSTPNTTRSFFDKSVDLDKATATTDRASRYAHLPNIDIPKWIQAPVELPPLFPFNRTTAYILIDRSETRTPKSITLRANSASGPLELSIPVETVDSHDVPSIHQLAARKAIQDLEEGRGSWLRVLKEKHTSRFDELVEKEAVRLGVQFQVAGKWTSFVAVDQRSRQAKEERKASAAARLRAAQAASETSTLVDVKAVAMAQYQQEMAEAANMPLADEDSDDDAISADRHGALNIDMASIRAARVDHIQALAPQPPRMPPANAPAPGGLFGGAKQAFGKMSGGLFGRNSAQAAPASSGSTMFAQSTGFGAPASGALFGGSGPGTATPFGQPQAKSAVPASSRGGSLFAVSMQQSRAPPSSNPFSSAQQQMAFGRPSQAMAAAAAAPTHTAFGQIDSNPNSQAKSSAMASKPNFGQSSMSPSVQGRKSDQISLHDLISLQKFSGAWTYSADLMERMRMQRNVFEGWKRDHLQSKDVKMTLVVLAFLEIYFAGDCEVWERIAAKAKSWLVGEGVGFSEIDGFVHDAEIEVLQDS